MSLPQSPSVLKSYLRFKQNAMILSQEISIGATPTSKQPTDYTEISSVLHCFLPRIPLRILHCILLLLMASLLRSITILNLTLTCVTLAFLITIDQLFLYMSPTLGLSAVYS